MGELPQDVTMFMRKIIKFVGALSSDEPIDYDYTEDG